MNHSTRLQRLAGIAVFFVFGNHLSAQTMVPWLTRSMDNSRSGWNSQETILSQLSVSSKGLVRPNNRIIPVAPVPVLVGDARGVEAQPLIMPNVKVADGTVHDLMVLPTMSNEVRAVDAHTGAGLWEVSLGKPIVGSTPTGPRKTRPDGCVGDFPTIDCHAINDHWGVLSTGVMDPDTLRLYVVAWVSPDGTPQKAQHFVNVLSLVNGSRVVAPVLVTGRSGNQTYSSAMRKQRSSLVLTNVSGVKTVLWASGTVQETAQGAAGWVLAFDCATNSITAALAMSEGEGAGIWMGGQGLAADSHGFLYGITGNGDFDGKTQFGESFVKIQYTPPRGGIPAALKVVDHWTPWTDLARAGQMRMAATKVAGLSAPSELMRPVNAGMDMPLTGAKVTGDTDALGNFVIRVTPDPAAMATGAWADEDWGSGGPACIFAIGVCVATGKDGIGYPINTAKMGGTMPGDLANRLRTARSWQALRCG